MTFALVCTSVALLVLSFWLFRQLQRQICWHKSHYDQRLQLTQENQALRNRIADMDRVIRQSVGGVDKRIREHEQIVALLRSEPPDLLKKEPGLQYWLSAHGEFFKALRDVSPSLNNKY